MPPAPRQCRACTNILSTQSGLVPCQPTLIQLYQHAPQHRLQALQRLAAQRRRRDRGAQIGRHAGRGGELIPMAQGGIDAAQAGERGIPLGQEAADRGVRESDGSGERIGVIR